MSIKSSSINIREIEFINGNQLDILKKNKYRNNRGNPLVDYSDILQNIEVELSNYTPMQIIQQKIKKYMTNQNLYLVELSDSYKYRPDLISYIFYGTTEYFQIILLLNQMKSLLDFVPANVNNLLFVFKPEIIESVTNYNR